MLVYRLSNRKFAQDLSGVGAANAGGRWNNKGRAMIYTSESTALALLEVIVNLPPMLQPAMNLMTIQLPEQHIAKIDLDELPENWYKYPYPKSLARIAEDYFNDSKIIALGVPSAIVHSSYNYLINPVSKNFDQLKLLSSDPFIFDPRVYRRPIQT